MSNNPAQADTPVIDMRGVTVTSMKSPIRVVAADVNWTVKPNEFWVVGAPQYTGKSDFLMTTGGIMSPASGEYWLLGERMPIFEELRMPHRLKLGFVFDGGQLLGHLTVTENIALPLQYHRRLPSDEILPRVKALLETMELTPWANNTPANVGRSWRQRAGLARALVLEPEVLLLDSPLTGLDLRHTLWWLGFLDQLLRGHALLGKKPITIVATADDLRPWRKHAGRVACISKKRLLTWEDWEAAETAQESSIRELLHG